MWNFFELGSVALEMLFEIFLSTALGAILFGGVEPFRQFWKRAL